MYTRTILSISDLYTYTYIDICVCVYIYIYIIRFAGMGRPLRSTG